MEIKRDWLGKRYTITAEDKLDEDALQKLNKYIDNLEEENKTLKANVEFLHSCLDDRDKSIELLKEKKKSEFGVCWLWLFFIIIYSLLVVVMNEVLPRE